MSNTDNDRYSTRFFQWIRESGLVRSDDDRWIGGVCGGLGRYLGWSPLLVRALMIGAAFVAGIGAVFYALAWFLLPDERDGRILCEELLAGRWDWSCLGVALGLFCLIFWPPVWLFGVCVGAFFLWLVVEQAGRRNLKYAVAHRGGPAGSAAMPYAQPKPTERASSGAESSVVPRGIETAQAALIGQMSANQVHTAAGTGNAPTGAAPVASAAVPPMMTSPYRAPQQAPKPRIARRKPAGPLLVLIVTGLIFLSFACLMLSWSDSQMDLETLLGGGLVWTGGVCTAIGLIIVILGCTGRRTGGLHPFAWLAAFLAAILTFGGLAYSVLFQRMMQTRAEYAYVDGSGLEPEIRVHGFDVIGSDKATMQRLEGGLWVEGDGIDDILHVDLSDYAEDNGSHEVTLNNGATATSSCPAGTIRMMPYRTSVMVTIPDGCSWQFVAGGRIWEGNDSMGGLWSASTSPWNSVGVYLPGLVDGRWAGAFTSSPPWLDADYDGEPLYWPFDAYNPKAVAEPELTISVDAAMMGQVVVQYEYQNTLPTYQAWAESHTEDSHE